MKKLFLALLLLAVLSACNDNDNVCTISGTLSHPVDTVYLVDISGEQLDVAAVNDGAFTVKCDIDPEGGVSVTAVGYNPIALIPDTKNISVAFTDSVPFVSGSPLSQEIQDFQQWVYNTYFEGITKAMAFKSAGDTISVENTKQEMFKQIADRSREIYQVHKADAIGAQALGFMMGTIENDEFIALYEQGGKAVKADAELGGYYEQLKSLPEEGVITLLENGDIVKEHGTFEDYVGAGSYTLVDFWASWCGPCRAEAPNVVAVYEKYRDKGLAVIGVPVNDKLEATKQAMKDLGIHYPQVLDPLMYLAERFNVEGIPYIILFAPDGSIVAANLRGAQIEEAVREVLP